MYFILKTFLCFSLPISATDSSNDSDNNSSKGASSLTPLADWLFVIIILAAVIIVVVAVLCFGILCLRRKSRDDINKGFGRDNWDMRNGYMYPDSPEPAFTITNRPVNTSRSPDPLNQTTSRNESPVRNGTQSLNRFSSSMSSPEPRFNSTAIRDLERNIRNIHSGLQLSHMDERIDMEAMEGDTESDVTIPDNR